MSTKHTKGPWSYSTYNTRGSVKSESGYAIAETDSANARLIAAAPELLEALNELLMAGLFHDTSDDKRAGAAVRLANKAIAKAEGGDK